MIYGPASPLESRGFSNILEFGPDAKNHSILLLIDVKDRARVFLVAPVSAPPQRLFSWRSD